LYRLDKLAKRSGEELVLLPGMGLLACKGVIQELFRRPTWKQPYYGWSPSVEDQ